MSELDMSAVDMSTEARDVDALVHRPERLAFSLIAPGQDHVVIDRAIVVGRAAECDVVLTGDTAASRAHARLVPMADGIQVVDLDSRNGVFVDGRRVQGAAIVRAGVVRLGDSIGVIAPARDEVTGEHGAGGPLVGGASLAACRRVASLVAATALPVHLSGETGAGKEVLARWIHELSARDGVFVAVNCAALPEHLVESELFGHVRGAFTGAAHARRGLIAEAAGGTLFLDEVGDLPAPAQAKLLRVLEDQVVRAVGAAAGEHVDFRVISATNVDLRAAIGRGAMRADLAARLLSVELHLPPLRERREDLPALCRHLLGRAGATAALSFDALEALARHDWPHNVRELDHVLRAAAAVSSGAIGLADLPERVVAGFRTTSGPAGSDAARVADPDRAEVERVLRASAGNVRQVAAALGLPRTRLYRLLAKWKIDLRSYRRRTGTERALGADERTRQ
jgi:DNA-binding NtrC family response regulator